MPSFLAVLENLVFHQNRCYRAYDTSVTDKMYLLTSLSQDASFGTSQA